MGLRYGEGLSIWSGGILDPPMSSAPALAFNDVSKHYRGFFRSQWITALRNFSLRVERGEIFGFLGPNGAGKTTAMHLAIGLMLPSSGRGEMLGHEFGHAPTRRRVGFLAENVSLYHRPAAKLVRFYGALNGMRDPQLRQRTAEMLKELELTDVADRNAGKFSRGMLQRIGLAQALVNDPDLLILDEPASALDPLGRMRVREILLRAREAGKTVFLSSHLLSEVEQICDRLAIVIKGRVARVGTLAELLESQDRFVITAKGIDALMFEGSQQNGFIKITVPALTQRRTIEKIWLAGGEVIAVNPIRRTLEDLFVELANQNGGGHRDDAGAREPQ
jgi:ABC-2 type transport system ATP-binding protein